MSKHFKMSEFSSPTVRNGMASYAKRRQVPTKYRPNVEKLMAQLEVIRSACGGMPLRVSSGWRDPEFNRLPKPGRKKTGKAPRSKHLIGQAADLTLPKEHTTPARMYWVIKDLMDSGDILPGGLAWYGGFVHYDIRGRRARWRKAPPRPKSGLGSKGS